MQNIVQKKSLLINFKFQPLIDLQSRLGESTVIFSHLSFPFSSPKVASISLYPTLRFKVGKTDGVVMVGFSLLQIIKFKTLNQLEQTHQVDSE